MTDYAPFPLIDLSGGPRERGRAHGRAVPDRIQRGIRTVSYTHLTLPTNREV